MTTVPEPPQTMPPGLSEEQQAALQTVQTYFTLLDQAQKDPEFNLTPFTLLFARPEAQRNGYVWLVEHREHGLLKVGDLVYHYEVDDVVEAAGVRSISVRVCVDLTHADLLGPDGESILDPSKSKYVIYDFDVVQNKELWQINDITPEEVAKC